METVSGSHICERNTTSRGRHFLEERQDALIEMKRGRRTGFQLRFNQSDWKMSRLLTEKWRHCPESLDML